MQRIPAIIPAAQLGTAAAAIYTTPALNTATVNNLSFTNTTTAVVSVTLHRVPSGGTAGAANTIVSAFALVPGQTWVPAQAIGLHLAAGMTLQAQASAATSVTVAGGVYETSGS